MRLVKDHGRKGLELLGTTELTNIASMLEEPLFESGDGCSSFIDDLVRDPPGVGPI